MSEAEQVENPGWDRIAEACSDDPGLEQVEKEALLSFARGDQKIRVQTRISSIASRLLRHPHFDCEQIAVEGTGKFHEMWLQPENWEPELGDVFAVEGTLPVGCLLLKSEPRANNHPSEVVADA